MWQARSACCPILYGLWVKDSFYIFKNLEKYKIRTIFGDTWKVYEIKI